ncbi:hypothetical protein RIF29_09667 [Crotalaria pallida]|uniref:Nucleoprotein TPR/MPL1 domain-containing protein n=1 Tax=Crotalaria pallida TaxID=3830 RepID=A0AAN9FYC0_CROPI
MTDPLASRVTNDAEEDLQQNEENEHLALTERLKSSIDHLNKELNEQKDLELSEKNATIKSYLDKIVYLNENAAHKEARLSEVEAELGRSRAACTRSQHEKEILERQNAWLNDELTAKVNSFFELRRKHRFGCGNVFQAYRCAQA